MEFLFEALKAFFCWVVDTVWQMFLTPFSALIGLIPDEVKGEIAGGVELIAKGAYGFDQFFPVAFAVVCGGFWLSWKVAYLAFRFVFRVIRG